jgi:prepilin-type N-terminal cleavage/methylation domain-containing protein
MRGEATNVSNQWSVVSNRKTITALVTKNYEPLTTRAFTLIEIMIVVAIMAICMTMSAPIIYRAFHREALAQTVKDIMEVCSNARARAIMSGTMTEVIFHPKDKRLEVSGGAGKAASSSPAAGGAVEVAGNPAPSGSGLSAQIPDSIDLQVLGINLVDYVEIGAEVARVRFYPNGTCDELTLILRSVDPVEQRGITLEVTTSLASVLNEQDLQKLRR